MNASWQMEAVANNYDEAIMLDYQGMVSEEVEKTSL